jgi:hypothetical protein
MTTNNIVFKTRQGLNRPTLATLDQNQLIEQTLLTLADVAPGVAFTVKTQARDKSHTKAAKAYGGGSVYRHTLRSNQPTVINSDTVYPQITIVDRTFAGGSLKVFVGFYRLICSNGLTVAVGENMKWSIDHRLSSVEQLMQLSRSIAAAWSKVIDAQQILENASRLAVNPRTIIAQLDMFSTERRERLAHSLYFARPQDNVQTAYGLYNFINELDRTSARRGSTAYLDRDTDMLATIMDLAIKAA